MRQRAKNAAPSAGWGELVLRHLAGVIGEHCALWTPAVGLAVADWLDTGANPHAGVDLKPMLAVASAYLGEPPAG